MGILAASIPTYRPLYRRLTSKHGLAKTVDQDVEPNDYKNNRLVDKNHQFGNDDHPTVSMTEESFSSNTILRSIEVQSTVSIEAGTHTNQAAARWEFLMGKI